MTFDPNLLGTCGRFARARAARLHVIDRGRFAACRRTALLLLALGIATGAAAAPFASPADEAAVRAAATSFETGWNRHDMDAMFQAFTPDAEFVNIVGMHWKGLPDIRRAHKMMHDSWFKTTENHIERLDVRQVAPDAAVAIVTWKKGAYTQPDGVAQPATRDVMTMFLVKQHAGWRITGAQNTPLDEGPAALRPGGEAVSAPRAGAAAAQRFRTATSTDRPR